MFLVVPMLEDPPPPPPALTVLFMNISSQLLTGKTAPGVEGKNSPWVAFSLWNTTFLRYCHWSILNFLQIFYVTVWIRTLSSRKSPFTEKKTSHPESPEPLSRISGPLNLITQIARLRNALRLQRSDTQTRMDVWPRTRDQAHAPWCTRAAEIHQGGILMSCSRQRNTSS